MTKAVGQECIKSRTGKQGRLPSQPNKYIKFATGSQDLTARVCDTRMLREATAVLCARMSAVRSLSMHQHLLVAAERLP